MLTLHSGLPILDCSGLSRRNFLRAGMLGLGGLSLPWLLKSRALAAQVDPSYVKDKAVVFVFCGGGASHIETFNPNMDAPEPYRSVTGEVQTTIPGFTLGGTFPLLAQHARKMAVVRSFRHPIGGHEQAISHVLTGGTDVSGQAKEGQSIGSMYTRFRGPNHPKTGMPTYTLLTAPHKDGQYAKGADSRASRLAGGHAGGQLRAVPTDRHGGCAGQHDAASSSRAIGRSPCLARQA